MERTRLTILSEGRAAEVDATIDGGRAFLSPSALAEATGWELKPEGFCRGGVCVPMRETTSTDDGKRIDFLAFARLLNRPVAIDFEERAACLGASARERRDALASLEAPDFTLPDLNGRLHSLSHERGKKVLLAAYSSW